MLTCCIQRKKPNIYSFPYGTFVRAESYYDAKMKIIRMIGKKNMYWASENEDGIWTVQLSDDITVEQVLGDDVQQAVYSTDFHLQEALLSPMAQVLKQ